MYFSIDSEIQDHICISSWKTDEGWRQISLGTSIRATPTQKCEIKLHRQSYMLTSTLGQAPIYNTSYLPTVSVTLIGILGKLK